MNINFSKINKNKTFIMTCICVIVATLLLTSLLSNISSTIEKVELEESGESKITSLVINEIMSSNGGSYPDAEGNLYDWIELYNGNKHDINLKNYGLTDESNTVKWVFPETIIKSHEYLIVFLSGKTQDGLYANFKLSSSGKETVAIKSPEGKVVDAVETVALEKNEVMFRKLDGTISVSRKSTPEFINTLEGYEQYKKSLNGEDEGIVINEVLPRNKGNFMNPNNEFSGYIEVKNTTNRTISLNGYGLSDDNAIPLKYQFPNISLSPNEIVLVFTSQKSLDETNYYTDFKLNEKNGVAILSNKNGKIISKVEYNGLTNGIALVKGEKEYLETSDISPGYENDADGINKFSKQYLKNNNDIIINEVMNNNSSYLSQNGGEYYDWIEIKNNTNETIELKNYYLSTNETGSAKWQFPDIKLNKNEVYVVMASGDSNLSNNSYKHTNFKLSETESLYLFKNKQIIDSILIANVPLGYSMGRNNESGYYYFSTPTPKKENGNGTKAIAYTPTFDIAPGICNTDKSVELTINANGTIYYTLDGSPPDKSSKVYKGPILLTKTAVVKAVSYETSKLPSHIITGSYIVNENHTIPVMSVSMKQTNFNSVQSNSWNDDLEVSAYAELYEDGKSFSIPCGFKLFGGTTRGLKKKSFALKFRSKYGAGSLNYQVFSNRDFSKFNTLVLRSGSTDYERTYFRDIFATSMLEELDTVEVQAYKTVALYINGTYWGLYDIREKIESEFIANRYNVNRENVNITRIDYDVTCGSTTWYKDIVNYVSSHDMSKKENYDYIKEKVDITSYIDFWVVSTYTTNNDIVNARFYSHPEVDNGKLKSIFYDQDWALYIPTKDYYTFSTSTSPMSRLQIPTTFLRNMMKNSEFKKSFVERVSYIMNNVLTDEKLYKRIDEIYNALLPEMPRSQARWGLTMETWNTNVDELKNFIKKRRKIMLDQTKSFFGLTSAQMKEYFGDDYG